MRGLLRMGLYFLPPLLLYRCCLQPASVSQSFNEYALLCTCRYGGYGTSPSPSPGPSPSASDGQLQMQMQQLREEHVDDLARQRRKADDDARRARTAHEEEVGAATLGCAYIRF